MCEKDRDELQLRQELKNNTAILSEQADRFIESVSPYLSVAQDNLQLYLDKEPNQLIDSMRFFRLTSCTTENIEDLADYLKSKMEKLFTAVYSLNMPAIYGIISYEGQANLVLGVANKVAEDVTKSLIEGLLTGIEMTPYMPKMTDRKMHAKKGGVISAVPILKVDDDKQKFDISALMRSMNGQNYTVLFVAKPYPIEWVQNAYAKIVDVRDKCFAVSKKNVARQKSESMTTGSTESTSSSHTFNAILYSYSTTKNVTKNLSKTIGDNETISSDVQNGVALEMIQYCDKAIERLKQGQTTGFWGASVAYSSDSEIGSNILKSFLCGELSKASTDILPLRQYSCDIAQNQDIAIPVLEESNPLLAPITSAELGMICTLPFEPVPHFELKQGKVYPMVGSSKGGTIIGKVSDGHRPLPNIEFSLSDADLNKHTFICGITGSGKTTTVKGILTNCKKPFMVIESAKKEYRNISSSKNKQPLTVYTLGKPEINCLQFNPFYVQCGVNLQTHIDFVKDLFNASFSFYGPMPYILETCLHNIYKKKGWNLTLGYHPCLVNLENAAKIFDSTYMKNQYALESHKYLFPTMQDLKGEVKRYIEEEMQYDSEVGGNIKTAIIARLESLCVGSKGFMFNTNEFINMDKIMRENIVFELEGLADDSDKAFCVGLLVIFINEYRQITKEETGAEKLDLQHLLVIEEAHRLLKNMETERSSENMGNPKGKAVEHFTNMIAEMRSYGQGVIIAEQIPSKLAPDVIKNSSNKIIQRVVSADDQSLVANTIGMKEEDAVYLGSLRTGVALCHKEGMSLPVYVFVNDVQDDFTNDDELLLKRNGAMFENINYSLIKESASAIIENLSLKILNALLGQSQEYVVEAIKAARIILSNELVKKSVSLVMCRNRNEIFGQLLAENILQLLMNGAYSLKTLVNATLYRALMELMKKGKIEDVKMVKTMLKDCYKQEPRNRCILIVSELIKLRADKSVNVALSIQQYFFEVDTALLKEIEDTVNKGVA